MPQKQEEQKCDFNDKQLEILQQTFNVGKTPATCTEKSLQDIIDSVIKYIVLEGVNEKDCIRKYWFAKQIEEWKEKKKEMEKNNADEEPSDGELMDIVKKDLKIRMANIMLALVQRTDIDKQKIWFYQNGKYVSLHHNDVKICPVLDFHPANYHISPPCKPYFMENQNDSGKPIGVFIYKHGNDENEGSKNKTKWIMARFKDDYTYPQCKITFQTYNKNNKITNVVIETAKDENHESTYTISLNDKGQVAKITKNDEDNKNKDYKDEIKQLLYKDKDNINQHLIENIELELDSKQKQVFDKIKEYIGIEEIKKNNKKDEVKIEEKNKKGEKEKRELEKDSQNDLQQYQERQNDSPQYHLCNGMCDNPYIGYDEYEQWRCFI